MRKTSRRRFKVTAGSTSASKTATGKTAAAVLASDAAGAADGKEDGEDPVSYLWEEDKTRSGNCALNACLAILRVALITVRFRQDVSLTWARIIEQGEHSTVSAMSLINGKSTI